MAHVTLHFSFGIAVATAILWRRLWSGWRAGIPMAPPLGRWLLWSYAAGFYATIPSLLRQAGLSEAVCDGWGMNVFLLYSLIKHLFTFGGMPLGALALGFCFVVQYATLLAAIVRARRKACGLANPQDRGALMY